MFHVETIFNAGVELHRLYEILWYMIENVLWRIRKIWYLVKYLKKSVKERVLIQCSRPLVKNQFPKLSTTEDCTSLLQLWQFPLLQTGLIPLYASRIISLPDLKYCSKLYYLFQIWFKIFNWKMLNSTNPRIIPGQIATPLTVEKISFLSTWNFFLSVFVD
jgi:hypothetical protein